jgi:Domain of unknown function (DUF4260)
MSRHRMWANPIALQRLEGLALSIAGVWIFAFSAESWWLFGLLLLVPDLSMVGYLRNPAVGAATYNLGHSLIGPALLTGWGVFADSSLLLALGAVWLAHVGVDRLAGYGLKYADGFHHTHLGVIGPGEGTADRLP